jgi:hypothetical protein
MLAGFLWPLLFEGSGSFSIPALSARGIARASRNNRIEERSYGSYHASIKSEPAQ